MKNPFKKSTAGARRLTLEQASQAAARLATMGGTRSGATRNGRHTEGIEKRDQAIAAQERTIAILTYSH